MKVKYHADRNDNDASAYDDDGKCLAYWWRFSDDRRKWMTTESLGLQVMDDFGDLVEID